MRNEDDGTEYNPGEDIFADEQGVSMRSVSKYLTEKKLCFVCNNKRICDQNSYREGGLGRCTEDKAAQRLLKRKDEYMRDKDGKYYAAANRLQMIISGECHDIFAANSGGFRPGSKGSGTLSNFPKTHNTNFPFTFK